MSSADFNKLLLQKLEHITQEQRSQREENQKEHREIKTNLFEVSKKVNEVDGRLGKAEIKLKVQQTGLYAISASIGALLWKVPALITWIKTQIGG